VALQVDQLRHMADAHPDRVAYVDLSTGEELTFAAWEGSANRLARGLAAAGVRPGDRVALFLESTHPLRWIVAKRVGRRRAGAAGILPLRFRGKAIDIALGQAGNLAGRPLGGFGFLRGLGLLCGLCLDFFFVSHR